MKFKFKIQQYQTDAVESTVNVFKGQVNKNARRYDRDLGKHYQRRIGDEDELAGYRNQDIDITPERLLENIREMQRGCDIKESASLSSGVGQYANLDIEMETGTGKTYVYIKTMFELNKQYGWTKFIVVVPSIAIREGVYKSFKMLEDHFMEHYQKKARFFIYRSDNLQQLDAYSSDAGINVMIINSQAFAKDMKAEVDKKTGKLKTTKAGLIIYSKRDEFQSRRPIDVLSANRPIIIMDEPQKMEGEATQKGLKNFKPLFVLNYSATHKTAHNQVYALDALDAYRQKLVKKIQVKGFTLKNLKGTNGYLYLDNIILSKSEAPKAKLEFEVKTASGNIKRQSKIMRYGDNLQTESGLNEYQGYVIDDINPWKNSVSFTNGVEIVKGEVLGDTDEKTLQRLQIRETIESHFLKEAELFAKGIKCLSLFFIDEVANYKTYENNEEEKGYLWKVFEEEYFKALNSKWDIFDSDYQKYLRRFSAEEVHAGYFSIDKKSGHSVNSSADKKTGLSDDISAYDLILKNKERLLSFDEPVRFIFSHSALREGWDNPNVFQICTLRHASSSTAKRQEVGRGLRLCVDQNGNRMDFETLGEDVQEVNKLTVIANESYADFTKALQAETREILRERPSKADVDYFIGKVLVAEEGKHIISISEAESIKAYLWDNDYIDENGAITQQYKDDSAAGKLEPLPKKLRPLEAGIHNIIKGIFDETAAMDEMVDDGNQTQIPGNELNANFAKEEFQNLWKELNHQYAYTVHYDSNELIRKVAEQMSNMYVTKLSYVVTTGEQEDVDKFVVAETSNEDSRDVSPSTVKYDLVGEIARGATLTRRTVIAILKRRSDKLIMFRNNPEEFIKKVIQIIKEQKATMIVESIQYSMTEGTYDTEIFTQQKHNDFTKAYSSKKHITDYVFTDGMAEKSTERKFAEALDAAGEVCVYAKLPRTFKIPTPVGNYSPDWAIAFHKGAVKHVFFVAETKGSMESMQMRKIEDAKINCAEKLFNEMSNSKVRYHKVASYGDLLECMQGIG